MLTHGRRRSGLTVLSVNALRRVRRSMARGESERGPLSRAEILDAALDLAEEHGLDMLSLDQSGAGIGVSAMSLYEHIDDTDHVLDPMGDHPLRAMPRRVTRSPAGGSRPSENSPVRSALRPAHPMSAPLLLTRCLNSRALMPVVEVSLATLEEAGLDERDRVRIMGALVAILIGTLVRKVDAAATVAADSTSMAVSSVRAWCESGLPRSSRGLHPGHAHHEGRKQMTITILETGTVAIRPAHRTQPATRPVLLRRARVLADRQWTQPLPINTYLIDHVDGPVLVDTGESPRATASPSCSWATPPRIRICSMRS